MFGVGKIALGLLIFRSQEVDESYLLDKEYFDNI